MPPDSFLHSTPVATETHPAPVVTAMSVLEEQEAEWLQSEAELEERLQREAEEGLATRIAYIKSGTRVVEGGGGREMYTLPQSVQTLTGVRLWKLKL